MSHFCLTLSIRKKVLHGWHCCYISFVQFCYQLLCRLLLSCLTLLCSIIAKLSCCRSDKGHFQSPWSRPQFSNGCQLWSLLVPHWQQNRTWANGKGDPHEWQNLEKEFLFIIIIIRIDVNSYLYLAIPLFVCLFVVEAVAVVVAYLELFCS